MWNQATAGKVPLAVRKPVYARMIGKDACIGLYDDAMLADETHMGTFGIRTQKKLLSRKAGVPRTNIPLSINT